LGFISSGESAYVQIENVTDVGNDVHVLATFHKADGSLINDAGLNIKLVAEGMIIYPFDTEVDGWSPAGTYDFVITNCVENHYNNFTVSMIDYSGRYSNNSTIYYNTNQQPGDITIGGNATSNGTNVNVNVDVGDTNNSNIYYPSQNITVIPQPDDNSSVTPQSDDNSPIIPPFNITTGSHDSTAIGTFVDDRVGNHTVVVQMMGNNYYNGNSTTLSYTVEPHDNGSHNNVPMQPTGFPLAVIFNLLLLLGGSLMWFKK
jgi:hypothetical protein